jgi:hypothetical protein
MSKTGLTLLAAATASALACGKNGGFGNTTDASTSADAPLASFSDASLTDARPDRAEPEAPDASEAAFDVSAAPEASRESGALEAGGSTPTQSFLRIANFAPDAPAAGYDVCLAPVGTASWIGPLLAATFAPGSLGQGGANGIQFPWVSAYIPVAPGAYDLQLVAAGATDCQSGVIPATYGLPELVPGGHTMFAVVGNVLVRGSDAILKIAVFPDDTATTPGAALRVINAVSSVGYEDVGTGSEAAGTFAPLVTDVAFATVGTDLADGSRTDQNGYFAVAPISGAFFSAHPSGVTTADSDTATNVSLAARSVTTLVLLEGLNSRPQQFLACTETAPANGALSACTVLPR